MLATISNLNICLTLLGVVAAVVTVVLAILLSKNSQRDYDSDFIDHDLW